MLVGILQGLGVIWAMVAAVMLVACHPSDWDAPISRYYPWWCLGWPLLAVAFVVAAAMDVFSKEPW